MTKTLFKKSFTLLLFGLAATQSHAQFDNYWVMSLNRALDFNTKDPTPRQSSFAGGNTSSIADSSGKLLFYADADTVWDRNNHPLPFYKHNQKTRYNALPIIIPKSQYEYYLFNLKNDNSDSLQNIYFTIIDIRLNSGLGDFKPGTVNTKVQNGFFSGIGCARKNGGGYWLLARSKDSFFSFSIDSNPLTLRSKTYIPETPKAELYPEYTISPSNDGKFIVATNHYYIMDGIDLINGAAIYCYDFNDKTGEFTNQQLIMGDSKNFKPYKPYYQDEFYYNCAFSPSDSLFYVTYNPYNWAYPREYIIQFQRFSTDIGASAIWLSADTTLGNIILDIKSAPDGKIYFMNRLFSNLGVITEPDKVGAACSIVNKGVYCQCFDTTVMTFQDCLGFFPTTIPNYKSLRINREEQCSHVLFTPKADSIFKYFTWYFQDAAGNNLDSFSGKAVSYTFKHSGKYVVTVQGMSTAGYKKWWTDTVMINVHSPVPVMDVKTDVVAPFVRKFSVTNPNYPANMYRWHVMDSAQISDTVTGYSVIHKFSKNGTYQVSLSAVIPGLCSESVETSVTIDEPFSLNIYPNPFSLQSDIHYVLSDKAHISISVTDMIGRELGTLIDKTLDSGDYNTIFDAATLKTLPGMYIIVFKFDDKIYIRKIIQLDSMN